MRESKHFSASYLRKLSNNLNRSLLLLRLGMMNLILILSHPWNIQGREPYLYDFLKKQTNKQTNFNVALYSDICGPNSFKLGIMIETTEHKFYTYLCVRQAKSRTSVIFAVFQNQPLVHLRSSSFLALRSQVKTLSGEEGKDHCISEIFV